MYGKENRERYRVYVLSVAAHHPTGSRAQVFPDHPLCCGRTPSTPRSITSLTHTRGASPVPQFDAQPATTPRAPPNERVLSHVGSCNDSLCGHSPSSTLYRVHDRAEGPGTATQHNPPRPHVSARSAGAFSITARTTARRASDASTDRHAHNTPHETTAELSRASCFAGSSGTRWRH